MILIGLSLHDSILDIVKFERMKHNSRKENVLEGFG